MASGCLLTRGAGIGGAQQGFKIGEAEWAEVSSVAQGNRASQPRLAVFALTHFHKAEVEGDFWRGEFAKRDGWQYVVLPDATGIKSVGGFGIAGFLRQRADGEAD